MGSGWASRTPWNVEMNIVGLFCPVDLHVNCHFERSGLRSFLSSLSRAGRGEKEFTAASVPLFRASVQHRPPAEMSPAFRQNGRGRILESDPVSAPPVPTCQTRRPPCL